MSRFAAIDVGTNSVLLLVAEREANGRFVAIAEGSDITRLGQGVDQTRRLGPEAMEATLKAIERYATQARDLGASDIVVSATSAARDASNGPEFIEQAQRRAQVTVEIISGEEEARLSFSSAHADFGGQSPLVVLDIGGGSTEFVFGEPGGTVTYRRSFDVGSVRLTERHIRTDPPSRSEIATIEELLRDAFSQLPPPAKGARMVGVAGTVTTLAAVARRVAPYDPHLIHGLRLTRAEIDATTERLSSLPTHLRKTVPGLQPKRADVIVAGALVCKAALQATGIEELTVSDRGLRWGLLADRFSSRP